jgi:hypothetical protein
MATDVIIDPSNGQIYWNDGTGTPQSISLGGNSQDTITVTGYGAAYSPGSAVGGTTVLVRFKDSALETLAPGTNGYELGSATLRWTMYGTTSTFSNNSSALGTNSTSLTSGTVLINGGVGISGNASIGQSLNFFSNTDSRFFIAFRAPSGLASTTLYTLPTGYPAVTGYVLASDTSGNLSWASASGSGGGNTAQNVVINFSNGATVVNHPILFTPAQSSSSGAAVSADASLSFNSSTNILSVSGLAITSNVASTGTTTGALIVYGGLGVTGQINAASVVIAGNAVVNGNLQFKGVGTFGDATTDTITSLARYASDLLPNIDNSYDLGNVALGWRYFKVTGIGTLGTVYVTDTTQTTSTTSGALIVSGGAGIAGTIRSGGTLSSIGASIFGILYTNNIQIGQGGNNINFLDQAGNTLGNFNTSNGWFRSAQTTQSISTTTGALVSSGGLGIAGNAFIGNTTTVTVTTNSTTSTSGAIVAYGGVGIGQSLSVGGRLQLFNGANYTAFVSSASGNTVYILPASTPATGTSVLQSTVSGVMSWVPMTAGGSGVINSSTVKNIAYYSAATTLSGDSVASGNYFYYDGLNTGLNIAHIDNETAPTASTKLLTVGTGATNYSTVRKALAVISTNNPWANGDLLILGVGGLGSSVRFGVDWTGRVQIGTPGTGFTIPATNGTSGQVLTANTNGLASWTTVTAGGSGTVNSGTAGSVAFYEADGTAVSGTGLIQILTSGTAISVNTNLDLRSANDVRFFNSGNTAFTALQAGAVASPFTLTLPTALPAIGSSIMVSDSTGNMSFVGPGSGISFSSATANTPIIRAKRPLSMQFSAGYTPLAAGPDNVVLTIPDSAVDGTSAVTFSLKDFYIRVETPSAGSSRIQLERSTGTGAFTLAATGSSYISGFGLTISGAGIYTTQTSSFAGTLLTSGDNLRLNWTLLNATHANFSVQLLLEEV